MVEKIDVSVDIKDTITMIDSILDQYHTDPAAIGTDHYKMQIYNCLQLSRALLVQYNDVNESFRRISDML